MSEKNRPLHVVKFGGTSVQDAAALDQVRKVVVSRAPDERLVVVLSAMGGITDLLLDAAHSAARGEIKKEAAARFAARYGEAARQLLRHPKELLAYIASASAELVQILEGLSVLGETTPRILDKTVARGERTLARLFAALLSEQGVAAVLKDGSELIQVRRQFGTDFPDLVDSTRLSCEHVLPLLGSGKVVVVPGYIGRGEQGELVTLGRGGSDLSASVLGHALDARAVTLYKEVDGLLTADPRHVPEARIVPELHFREAAELAYYGAKVLHPRTIIPLLGKNIPLLVRNTWRPDEGGTRIAADVSPGAFPVKALTASFGQAIVTIEGNGMMGVPGVAARTFQALATAGISVSVISQASSEASICLVVPEGEANAAARALKECFAYEMQAMLIDEIRIARDLAVLAAVGQGMSGTPGIAARAFQALARAGTNIQAIAQGSSELNITAVVAAADAPRALASLHREFRLEKFKSLPARGDTEVSWSLLGVGQIGRTLLAQVLEQDHYFREKMQLGLCCHALIDSSGMHLCEAGFARDQLSDLLRRKEAGLKLAAMKASEGCFVYDNAPFTLKEKLWQLPLRNGIFVDTTASSSEALILEALEAGWHVVVANKKPLAVAQERFDAMFETARERGVYLRYEATVGAGLPILDTLAKLEEAGDTTTSIKGCFSGTLGYLMSKIAAGQPFSEAVRTAYALGYMEPDPREDLSGLDVARKALILARTLGKRLDLKDIAVEPLFDESADHRDPEKLFQRLAASDAMWRERVRAAQGQGQELRYVASIEGDDISVGIRAVDAASPFGQLRGTDNLVTVTTRRYDQNPLVVSGPGAGASVTAAGVLNDMLAIATSTQRLAGAPQRRR